MTRTWSLGRAAPEVQTAYNDVMSIFYKVMDSLKIGEQTSKYQVMTLDHFEERGHPTQRNKPGTMEGYVHSLGHGIGLNVHESYVIGHRNQGDAFEVGNVFTIEPGLYYPDRGYGVRVEDTVYASPDGRLMTLTDMPKDLILPLRG